MEYEVRITVKQVVTVRVEAEDMAKAKAIAQGNWQNKEYDLDTTHSRIKRENVVFEPLYPNLAAAR